MHYDVIIVGAGAAGLAAAADLADHRKKLHILVMEKEKLPGRKLNATGNGKCNVTNRGFGRERYFSQDEPFVQAFAEHFSYEQVVSYFERIGIKLYEKDGYYYPLSNQARQVTKLLYQRCMDANVAFQFETEVQKITPKTEKDGTITYIVNEHTASCVLLAMGGSAAPKLGGSASGYLVAKGLQLALEPVIPVLTPAYVKESYWKIAKGVRLDAVISLRQNGKSLRREAGQLQINEDSLSGIAMMNLSCLFNHFTEEERKNCLQVDVLPGMNWNQVKEYLQMQQQLFGNETVSLMLEGLFPAKFVQCIVKALKLDPNLEVKKFTEKQLNRIVSFVKKIEITPQCVPDIEKAQVSAGGVSTKEIWPDTFEAKKYPGLYLAGELLDVNGECGGYNLTFAFLSAIQAACHIRKRFTD